MKKIGILFLCCCVSWLANSGQLVAQTFNVAGPPAVNVDQNPGSVHTLNVAGPGTITDINVAVELTNSFQHSTDVLLTHVPSGTSSLIFATVSDDINTFNITFDDEAAGFAPHSAPAMGTFLPDNPLTVFDGLPVAGNWTLTITEQYGFTNETDLNAWSIFGTLISGAVPATAPAIAGRRRSSTPTLFVADTLAMLSAASSGVGAAQANIATIQFGIRTMLRDPNKVQFRIPEIFADGFESGDVSAWRAVDASDSSSLLRYLAFVQDENMSYKVALGLADAEERTVEVNMTDTLSAQAGTMLNGQSLGGGLPYAMMGVPLMPMAGGAATVKIVEAVPSGKAVIEDGKAVVEATPLKRWGLYASGDFSFYDQDQLSDLMQGFDTDTYAGSVGIEYSALHWLNIGLAWGYLESDTTISGNYGDIDLEGNMISGYATAFWRQYWADLLYSYGSFNSDIARNTGLGSTARGDTDSQSHNIRLNFGRNFTVGNNIVTGPTAGLFYSDGKVDPYSERGGGRAALDYDGTDFDSMVSRVGWQATHFHPTGWGRLVSQVRLAWEHEYMPENGTVRASLQTSPFALVTGSSVRRIGGFTAEGDGAHPGTDWLSAGAGLRFELDNGVSVLTDYEGVFFRSDVNQHFASAKLSYEWGAFMPREKGSGKDVVDYESLTAEEQPEQPEQHVATTSQATESDPQPQAEKKKSSGDFLSWLRRKDRNGTSASAASESNGAIASDQAEVEQVSTRPAAEPIPSRGNKKSAVVYKTWDDVPGVKKAKAPTTAPAKTTAPAAPPKTTAPPKTGESAKKKDPSS